MYGMSQQATVSGLQWDIRHCYGQALVVMELYAKGSAEQVTVHALVVSLGLSVMLSVIVMELNLTTGIIPSLNVASGLLGFFFIKVWTKALERARVLRVPFTRKANTVIQICVVAAYGLAFSGGYDTYLFGMSLKIAGQTTEANDSQNIKDPKLGWMLSVYVCCQFCRIVFYRAPQKGRNSYFLFSIILGDDLYKVLKVLTKSISEVFQYKRHYAAALLKWGVSDHSIPFPPDQILHLLCCATDGGHGIRGKEGECRTTPFPFLLIRSYIFFAVLRMEVTGLEEKRKQVRTLGKFFSFSFLWGFFQRPYKSGDDCGFEAFPTLGLKAYENKFNFDFSAMYVGIGMICPQIVNVTLLIGIILSWGIMWPLINNQKGNWYSADLAPNSLDGLQGYRVLTKTVQAFVSDSQKIHLITLPVSDEVQMAKQPIVSYDDDRRAEWYFILVAYALAPVLAFCNAYGCGLTNWNMASTYTRLATASDLMQDFKTGYLTLSSPRSMFVSHLIGISMGCVVAPWVNGVSSVLTTKALLILCYIFFVLAILINLARDLFLIRTKAAASGLICGDGIWSLPQAVLALAQVKPPICMKFLSRKMNEKESRRTE
ncbi:hypothetical protein ZIOFF_030274 [Zingiber officinale]|uniref:Uncharacterized protein n=1 Tax=Zingiber officinale TaxID=94328 RepID=A0A8J5H3H1_ZINOF|nr:hypothetical protein ZIOFF_030274 [Zingiber officinale]